MCIFILLIFSLLFSLQANADAADSRPAIPSAKKVYQLIEKEEMRTYDISPVYVKKQRKPKFGPDA